MIFFQQRGCFHPSPTAPYPIPLPTTATPALKQPTMSAERQGSGDSMASGIGLGIEHASASDQADGEEGDDGLPAGPRAPRVGDGWGSDASDMGPGSPG